jgi:hypothetical protein
MPNTPSARLARTRDTSRPRCSREGCTNAAIARGMCDGHIVQARNNDTSRPPCAVYGCARPWLARGLCNAHYKATFIYGLTPEEIVELHAQAAGHCAICDRVPDDALHVDHDHATGTVRALLCSSCNLLIGHAGEDPDRLLAAAAYLLRLDNNPAQALTFN